MTDDEFRRLISGYLDTANQEMTGVELDMMEGNNAHGADHALNDHGVSQEEIRQVIYEQKRSEHGRESSLFWGSTRNGRDITVAVHDTVADGMRRLSLITAFDETEEQWRRRR